MTENLKRTPLFEKHRQLKGKLIDFGGWELPVQYEPGILAEHRMTRESAGLFDVSHMGEVAVEGSGAEAFLQSLLTNDVAAVESGETQYNVMCYENGGCVDDLIVYKYSTEKYLLVVNASNTDKDFDWISSHAPGDVRVENRSAYYAQLALQGPLAQEILSPLTDADLTKLRFFHFVETVVAGKSAILSRTGYTGEDGFEIYCASSDAPELWDALLTAGGDRVLPIGLGARDTLRFEAKLPLYGHEISESISPLEARLGYFVKTDKPVDFIGKAPLAEQRANGPARLLCEVEMVGRGIPRAGYELQIDGKTVGTVTTGMAAPTLKKNIALALVDAQYAEPGTKLDVIIRDKPVAAEIRKGIFYKKRTTAR